MKLINVLSIRDTCGELNFRVLEGFYIRFINILIDFSGRKEFESCNGRKICKWNCLIALALYKGSAFVFAPVFICLYSEPIIRRYGGT